MTLCIAAVCDDVEGKETKIVLCADLEKQTECVGGSETEDKLGYIKSGWPCLLAGTISRANDLINVYAKHFSDPNVKVDEYSLIDHLRQPAHIQKKKLVDEYLQQTYAFDRDYFYDEGMKKFPETYLRLKYLRISRGSSLMQA